MAAPKDIQLASELEKVMDQIEHLKAQLVPLQEQETTIRTDLTAYLLKIGRDYTRTTSGLGFGLVKGRVTYKVIAGKEQEAIEWARAEYPSLLTIASAKLNKVVQPMLNPPSFVERTEGEPHLAVRTNEE